MTHVNAKQIYINETVLEAARRRITFIFDEFENIIVSISGGKDSTVLVHLSLLEAQKRNRRIGLYFIDEEVVYQSTIDQINYLINLFPDNSYPQWLQIEFNLTNSLSYREQNYLKCWEKGKHKIWMRSKVEESIKFQPWDKLKEITKKQIGLGFYEVVKNFQRSKTNTAFLIGLRATESPNRWRAVSKNKGYKDKYYCTKAENGNVQFYPIYDWNFHDIWKYLYDEKIPYSKIYDYMWKKGMNLQEIRVSSLIHEHSFKALVELPEFEPKTYDKLLKRIDGISIGNLYGKESKMLKVRKLPKNFINWQQYRDFLLQTYPNETIKPIFVNRFAKHFNNEFVARQQCRQLILNDIENNIPVSNKEDPRDLKIKKWKEILLYEQI
jgi:predicted phosphoadenosine phosphosulfate sulfurtransferase